MSTIDMIRTMKQVHPDRVILTKIGKFFHAYGKDAYIISYLFNYQLKRVETNINTTGFPEAALNKVLANLEDKKISYMLVDRGANYEVYEENNFKQANTYFDIYQTAHKYQIQKSKADEIYEYLISNINAEGIREKMNKIEEILYEGR